MNGDEILCEFGVPGPLRDRLVEVVLLGKKTATSSLLVEWEHEGVPLSDVGERSTVINSGWPAGCRYPAAGDRCHSAGRRWPRRSASRG